MVNRRLQVRRAFLGKSVSALATMAFAGILVPGEAAAETPFYCFKTMSSRSEQYPIAYMTEIFDLDKVAGGDPETAEAIVLKRWQHWAPKLEGAYYEKSFCSNEDRHSHTFGLIPNNTGHITDIRRATGLPKDWAYLDPSVITSAQSKTTQRNEPKSAPKEEQSVQQEGPTATELAAEKHRDVEERNRQAQAKYEAELAEQRLQVEEYERAKEEVARKKAEQQAAAQRTLDAFKAEQAAYAEKLLRHQQDVKDHQAKVAGYAGAATASGGDGGKFQVTSAILETREAAMASLMRQGAPGPLTEIQCGEVKMYTPPKWTCWGSYRQDRKPAAGSAQ